MPSTSIIMISLTALNMDIYVCIFVIFVAFDYKRTSIESLMASFVRMSRTVYTIAGQRLHLTNAAFEHQLCHFVMIKLGAFTT